MMIQVIHDSKSIVMRSTHILLIRVEASVFGGWSPAQQGGVTRKVDLTLKLEEVLKGRTDEQPGDQLHIEVNQFGTGTTRIMAVLGVWSNHSLDPGEQLLAFCNAASNKAAEMLNDPFCDLLLSAEEGLTDVRLAVQAESQKLALMDVLKEARPMAASLGHVFPEYLWARYEAEIMEKPENFEGVMQFIEQPDLSYVTRATLLDSVYSQIIASPSTPADRVYRLAMTMFRLLNVPEAASLHDNLISVYLPNLLGLTGGMAKRTPGEVFRTYPGEQQSAEQALLKHQAGASPVELLRWLRS
jgi:hypothetical protein